MMIINIRFIYILPIIKTICWTIETIGKHVVASDTLTSRGVGVGVDESTDSGIVISGLEIIEPGLYLLAEAMRPFLTTFR